MKTDTNEAVKKNYTKQLHAWENAFTTRTISFVQRNNKHDLNL